MTLVTLFLQVDNNHSLYGGAKQFLSEINSLAATILNDLLTKIKTYGDQNQIKKQVSIVPLRISISSINFCK